MIKLQPFTLIKKDIEKCDWVHLYSVDRVQFPTINPDRIIDKTMKMKG